MNQTEYDYWDAEAEKKGIRDNLWKRQGIVQRLLREDWTCQRVLEIGVGLATAAAAIDIIILGKWQYIGTDLSKTYCDQVNRSFGFEIHNTDILRLPHVKDDYTRVLAFDSLEHVNPNDRTEGYCALNSVLAEHAKLYINMPLAETKHDLTFDHPFGIEDLIKITEITGLRLILYEEWCAKLPNTTIPYGWAVMER